MKLGFALKKTKKPALQSAGSAGGSGASGVGLSGVAGVFSSALPVKQKVEKVFVTDFDPNARAAVEFDKDGNVKKALVIPLIKTNEWKGEDSAAGAGAATQEGGEREGDGKSAQQAEQSTVKDDEAMLTADERAAKELLADAKSQVNGGSASGSGSSSHASNLVIPMNGKLAAQSSSANSESSGDPVNNKKDELGEDEKTRAIKAKLFNFESQERNRKKGHAKGDESVSMPTAPILRQNVVPGMNALEDVNEKYRLDVSMRPDELDVHSVAYDMVPIEDFGAALLRGMGWKGNVDNDDKSAEPKPRHKLLGLGATIRPPIPGEAKKKHKKKHHNNSQQQSVKPSNHSNEDSSKPRHSGLNHTEASSSKESSKQRDRRSSRSSSPRRSKDDSGRSNSKHDSRDRRRSSSRDRRTSRDGDYDNSRSRSKAQSSSRGSDDHNGSRRRSRSRDRGARDRSSERGRDRKREKSSRSERDDQDCDDRRKRSRSRDRSSDRKRSSRR